MRIRQHVNPLDLFFETFRGELPVLERSLRPHVVGHRPNHLVPTARD